MYKTDTHISAAQQVARRRQTAHLLPANLKIYDLISGSLFTKLELKEAYPLPLQELLTIFFKNSFKCITGMLGSQRDPIKIVSVPRVSYEPIDKYNGQARR